MDENQIDIYCSEHECVTRAYQEAKVCVPITVTPFANVGDITTECCGKAMISREGNCRGRENKSCKFTVIYFKVPNSGEYLKPDTNSPKAQYKRYGVYIMTKG